MKYYYLKRHKGIFKYFQNGHIKYGYRLRYYINHQQHERSRRGFLNLKQAITAYNNLHDFKLGKCSHSGITVSSWCDYYLNMIKPPVRKISTFVNYKNLLTENIIPIIGKYFINQLKLDIYQSKCINYLIRKGLSHRTIIETNARFQTVINYAVKSGYLQVNPIRFATISNKNNLPRKIIMNNHQLLIFNTNLKKHSITLQVLFFTLEYTGMRIGELLGLKWKDINLANHIIYINHTRDMLGIRTPKTPHSRREFKITNKLNSLLSKYCIYCKTHYQVKQVSLVMRGKHGRPLIPNLPSILLKRLLIESNLKNLIGRFTPHSFRHMLASRLIDKGISPITVSQILGHANPDITLKIYAQAKNGIIPNLEKLIK